jgi:dipeptidyl aminopeptidase/acylaminoacyl peptidase
MSITRQALFLALFTTVVSAQRKRDTVDYHKADLIRTSHAYVMGTRVSPSWLEDSVRFWYKSAGRGDRGTVYLVEPTRAARRILFDNARMAAALSLATDTIIDPARFPTFTVIDTGKTLELQFRKKIMRCGTSTYTCVAADSIEWATERDIKNGPSWASRSPDKKWDVFSYNYNLFVRPADLWNAEVRARRDSLIAAKASKDTTKPKPVPKKDSVALPNGSVQLTTGGVKYAAPGVEMFWSPVEGYPKPFAPYRPGVTWSPNSRKISFILTDSRGVRIYPMYSSTGDQPVDKSYPWATPGDSIIPIMYLQIADVIDHQLVKVQETPPNYGFGANPTWNGASDRVFYTADTRGRKRMRLSVVNASNGTWTKVMQDSLPTWVETRWRLTNGGQDILVMSERDGWNHMYRYAPDGTLKNQIESGSYRVNEIEFVDSTARQIYFSAQGKEPGMPYYARIYRINFDGSGLTVLTPEDGLHDAMWVPKAPYFIDTYSTVDRVPVTVLRAASDGRAVMELARGDAELLKQVGWTMGELFTVKARDGITDIWGIMYKPSDFDPKKVYPIITHIYPGPQTGSVRGWGFGGPGESRALAEVGFIVIELNHMGTPGRSKSFQDYYFGRMSDNGIPDHVAAIRQLAAKYSWIDVNKVGIFGASGGGFATADAMFRHADFFKVGVADAGNHDQRTYHHFWGEVYQGLYKRDGSGKDNFEAEANYTVAKNLKGRLLLMAGDLDNNVHPAATLRVVDALIKANKGNFDMLIVPDGGHGVPEYGIRRRWDYFVRYLLDKEPPAEYEMMKIDWRAMF